MYNHRSIPTPQSELVDSKSDFGNGFNPEDLATQQSNSQQPPQSTTAAVQRQQQQQPATPQLQQQPSTSSTTNNVITYWLGNLTLREEKQLTKQIDQHLYADRNYQSRQHTVLFLGPGDAGKSTIIKQFRHLDQSIDPSEIPNSKPLIFANAFAAIHTLCIESKNDDEDFAEEIIEMRDAILRWGADAGRDFEIFPISPNDARLIARLWRSEMMRRLWNDLDTRRRLKMDDNAGYLLDKIEDVANLEYEVTFEDFVHVRKRTTGLSVYHLKQQGEESRWSWLNQTTYFTFLDVGGQKGERKKWAKYFDNVDTLVFVASLASYAKTMEEMSDKEADEIDDPKRLNQIQDARQLFENTMGLHEFRGRGCILFLNKLDLFEEWIHAIPLSAGIPEFPQLMYADEKEEEKDRKLSPIVTAERGSMEEFEHREALIDWIQRWFFEAMGPRKKTDFFLNYVHVTTAVNSDVMAPVCAAVKNQVTQLSLREQALV